MSQWSQARRSLDVAFESLRTRDDLTYTELIEWSKQVQIAAYAAMGVPEAVEGDPFDHLRGRTFRFDTPTERNGGLPPKEGL